MKTNTAKPPTIVCFRYKDFCLLSKALNLAHGISEVAAERDHFLRRDVGLIRKAEAIMAKAENLPLAPCRKTIKYCTTSKTP